MTLADAKPCACPATPHLVEVLGVGDVALWIACPTCKAAWHRWPEGHYYRRMAARCAAEVA